MSNCIDLQFDRLVCLTPSVSRMPINFAVNLNAALASGTKAPGLTCAPSGKPTAVTPATLESAIAQMGSKERVLIVIPSLANCIWLAARFGDEALSIDTLITQFGGGLKVAQSIKDTWADRIGVLTWSQSLRDCDPGADPLGTSDGSQTHNLRVPGFFHACCMLADACLEDRRVVKETWIAFHQASVPQKEQPPLFPDETDLNASFAALSSQIRRSEAMEREHLGLRDALDACKSNTVLYRDQADLILNTLNTVEKREKSLRKRVERLNKQIEELEDAQTDMLTSTSWRLTAPLRKTSYAIREVLGRPKLPPSMTKKK